MRFVNQSLARLRSGDADRCVWLSLGAPALAELAAEAGATTIVFDLQHGLWERSTLEAAIGLVRERATVLVRVAENSAFAIGSALDAGAHGILVPMVGSAAEAAASVAAAHYPPRGIRSGGGIRPLADFPAYLEAVSRELLVGVMIETLPAAQQIDEIAAVDGIDLIFIGSGDLGLSLAGAGAGAPSLADTITMVRRGSEAAGVPCGLFTMTAADAVQRLREGFKFVVLQNDVSLARAGFAAAISESTTQGPDW